MLTISTTDGKVTRFNLKTREREEALRNLWLDHHPLSDGDRKFKITTDTGQVLTLCLKNISGIESNESYYAKPEVHTTPRQERVDPKVEFYNKMKEHAEKRERENCDLFFSELNSRGVTPDLNDPSLVSVLNSVKKETDREKIPIYANLYMATVFTKRKRR
jgi:hypothetical protein